MARIDVTGFIPGAGFGHQVFGSTYVIVQVLTVGAIDGIYALKCSLASPDGCGDLEPGDTWGDFHAAMDAAVAHVEAHERAGHQ